MLTYHIREKLFQTCPEAMIVIAENANKIIISFLTKLLAYYIQTKCAQR